MAKQRFHINLMDITSTEELRKIYQFPALIELLVKELRHITFDEIVELSDAQIYCTLDESTFEELNERCENFQFTKKHVATRKAKEVSNG